MSTPSPSLRERKKQTQRQIIQQEALRLFAVYGYNTVTVEQIAQASNISIGTFFNYFGTKAEVVLFNSLDDDFYKNFTKQPADLDIVQALRQALNETFATSPELMVQLEQQRFALIQQTPELQSTLILRMTDSIPHMVTWIQAREKRADLETIHILAGTIIGIGIAILLDSNHKSIIEYVTRFDAALTTVVQDRTLKK